ncbi:MAG: molybdopterin-dependent oxidoreductase [Ignavibacteria bacterium]|nr:molybdopterin-dependent oxidoreductase [Ignavibacteria bacterium]
MINIDAKNHVSGKSVYVDDIKEIRGTLFALPFDLPTAHAKITGLDLSSARTLPGIVSILTAKDIPGDNQIGVAVPDEPLFADKEVHFSGQTAGIIIGVTEHACRLARREIGFSFEQLTPVTCPRQAMKQGMLIVPPRTFRIGNTDDAWSRCDHIVSGTVEINGQEHIYMETQGSYAYLKEDGCIFVASSTQAPTAVQWAIARVLGIEMHRIEVDTVRIGGGFGGKEDQATAWAVMAALAAVKTGMPVKLILHRMDDIRMTGKRNPYSSDFRIGLGNDLKIMAYEVTHYQNAGASADLSPAILERTLFHSTNSYCIPNVTATAYSCRTNLPPNTAFRGFGGPQGMFVIESAIVRAAETIGVSPDEIQKANLIKDGDEMPYGQVMQETHATDSWAEAERRYSLSEVKNRVAEFNSHSDTHKKGFAVQPICFGISFTNTMMNHARALVHIYKDGSVVVSTGAVEMGQGVNTKLLQVASAEFGISHERVKIESTNTLRIANTSPTAASSGADLNGKALKIACTNLRERLAEVAKQTLECEEVVFANETISDNTRKKSISWKELVNMAQQQRVPLSEHSHYATPGIHFDRTKEKGHPFAYHVYGTAIIEATVDCLRGTYLIDSVRIVHDFGKSMNADVDHGQIEGGVVQGIGWMTMEEVMFDDKGKLLTSALSTYKIPDIYSVPAVIEIHHLDSPGSDLAIYKSKAVGEPPLMYALGAYFAIRKAVQAFNKGAEPAISVPYTPEKVLFDLYGKKTL